MLTKLDLVVILIENSPALSAYLLSKSHKLLIKCNLEYKSSADYTQLNDLFIELGYKKLLILIEPHLNVGKIVLINKQFELVIMFLDFGSSIIFGQAFNLPIFISEEYLVKEGIYVTRQLIEDILKY